MNHKVKRIHFVESMVRNGKPLLRAAMPHAD